eukprot:gene116-29_t
MGVDDGGGAVFAVRSVAPLNLATAASTGSVIGGAMARERENYVSSSVSAATMLGVLGVGGDRMADASPHYAVALQRRGKKYRPFIKPIKGPKKLYFKKLEEQGKLAQKRAAAAAAAASGDGDEDGAEADGQELDALRAAEEAQNQALAGNSLLFDPVARSQTFSTLKCTPFQALRFVQAFHPDTGAEDAPEIRMRMRLNIDLTRESVRGTCTLPHGLRTKTKLLVFCKDHEVEEMKALGADFAGIAEPTQRIQKGWLGFDRCIATPSTMQYVLKLARILGPRKLMPTPRSGTVVEDLRAAIKEVKGGGLLEYRAEGEGDLAIPIGDTSFDQARVLENMKFVVAHLLRNRSKESTAKNMIKDANDGGGKAGPEGYFKHATLGTDLGPGVPLCTDNMLPTSTGYFR